MMRSIFLRTLYDKRWFMLGWSFALSGMAVLMISMYPALSDSMGQIAATMPPQLRGLIGDIDSFTHLDSYISSQLFDIRIPLFLMIMATVLALGIGVSNEEKGVLRTVLSGKYSRVRWFIETWFAAFVIFVVALSTTGIVTLLTVWAIGETIDTSVILKLIAISLSLALAAFTLVFGIGAASGLRSPTLAIGVGMIVTSFILEAGRAVDWLDSAQYISLLHYYDASHLLKDGVDLNHQLVIVGILLVSFFVGIVLFRRRDIS